MKLDGYIRVSQVGKRGGDSFISPDVQRQQISRWAKYHDHTIVAWHEDLDQSGGTLNRPGFQVALARIEAGQSDGMIVAKLDRFGRSVPRIHEALNRITAAGGTFASVAEDLNLETANGRAQFNFLSTMAQFQRDQATEAWDISNKSAIDRGIHFSARVAFGYTRGPDRRLVVNEHQAPVVRELFKRRALRQSWRQLADWLDDTHPRTDRKAWAPRNAATMIQSRTYLGEAFHGEHRNPHAHAAIVSLEEFEAANAVKGGPGRIYPTSSVLAGLIRCAGCRYAMRRTFITRKDGARQQYYACQGRFAGGRCQSPAQIMAHIIEPYVVSRVMHWYGFASWSEGGDANSDALEKARDRLTDAQRHLDAFLRDDRLRDAVGRESFLSSARERSQTVDSAREDLERETRSSEITRRARHYCLEECWQDWERTDAKKSEFLRFVMDSIYIKKGRGHVGERALIFWDGQDQFEKPRRGTTTYEVRPIPWPQGKTAAFVEVPPWAQAPNPAQELCQVLADFTGGSLPEWPTEDGIPLTVDIEPVALKMQAMRHPGGLLVAPNASFG